MDAKSALERLTAEAFKQNNGIVMRSVAVAFPMRWFEFKELKTIVSDRIENQVLKKTVVYLADEGYLKFRSLSGGASIKDIMDAELDDMALRISPKGTRIVECVEEDILIEM